MGSGFQDVKLPHQFPNEKWDRLSYLPNFPLPLFPVNKPTRRRHDIRRQHHHLGVGGFGQFMHPFDVAVAQEKHGR